MTRVPPRLTRTRLISPLETWDPAASSTLTVRRKFTCSEGILDYDGLGRPGPEEHYFPDLFRLLPDEVLPDLWAGAGTHLGPRSLLLAQVEDSRSLDLLRTDSAREFDMQIAKAGSGKLDLKIRAQLLLAEVVQRGGRQLHFSRLSECVAGGNRSRRNEIVSIQAQTDAVVLGDACNVDVKFRVPPDAA